MKKLILVLLILILISVAVIIVNVADKQRLQDATIIISSDKEGKIIDNSANYVDKDNDNKVPEKDEINVPIKGTEKYYEGAKLVKPPYSITVLVNKKNVLKEDYVPEDLKKLEVFAPNRREDVQYLREEAADSIMELVKGAEEDDLEILPASGYRSYNLQHIIFENNVNSSGSVEKANETSALPGQSEHQSGLAIDVSCKSVNYRITDAFGDTEEAKWVAENAHKYGFIIRYQKGKESITEYTYEPWHLRYVGKETAIFIYENDLTLEEYSEK